MLALAARIAQELRSLDPLPDGLAARSRALLRRDTLGARAYRVAMLPELGR